MGACLGDEDAERCRDRSDPSAAPSLLQARRGIEQAAAPLDDPKEKIAISAPLDELGYKQVATLKSNSAMEAYIRRVISSSGCRVSDEPNFQGFIPFYSGVTATQNYANLETEIYRFCTETGTWLTSLYPRAALAAKDEATKPGTLGLTAPLTEQGFQEVLRFKDELQMLKYVRRVVSKVRGLVVDESGLYGLLPFFTGEKSVQTLGALILEIEEAMQRPDSWVIKAEVNLIQKGTPGRALPKADVSLIQVAPPDDETEELAEDADTEQVPGTALKLEAPVRQKLDEVMATKESRVFRECSTEDLSELHAMKHSAMSVSLDQDGYEAMVRMKSDCAMMMFVQRVIQELRCRVLDESGLKGLVPFYSGTQGEQDIQELRTELTGVCQMEGRWMVPDVKYWAQQAEADPNATSSQAESTGKPESDQPSMLGGVQKPMFTNAAESDRPKLSDQRDLASRLDDQRDLANSLKEGRSHHPQPVSLLGSGATVVHKTGHGHHATKQDEAKATGHGHHTEHRHHTGHGHHTDKSKREQQDAWGQSTVWACRTLNLFCP